MAEEKDPNTFDKQEINKKNLANVSEHVIHVGTNLSYLGEDRGGGISDDMAHGVWIIVGKKNPRKHIQRREIRQNSRQRYGNRVLRCNQTELFDNYCKSTIMQKSRHIIWKR